MSSTVVGGFVLTDTPTPDPAELTAATGWVPAVVPGGVHESLVAAGLVEHPYFGENEASVAWVEDRTWWYRTALQIPVVGGDERLRLVFAGLDAAATVWLDGELRGDHETQFRPFELDVTAATAGSHELLVRFVHPTLGLEAPADLVNNRARLRAAAVARLEPQDRPKPGEPEAGGVLDNLETTLRRKATFSWGWDFAPRLPSIGLWQGVTLERERGATVADVHAWTAAVDVDAGTAELRVEVVLDAFAAPDAVATVELVTPGGARLAVPGDGRSFALTVTDAELWWTHDLGAQPLYDVVVTAAVGDDVLAVRTERVGLRTVTVDQSPDPEGGSYFRFVLNGFPVFARGANWVPNSMLVGSVTARHRDDLVALSVRGGMTMIRMWGGGVYEPDDVYASCDARGVLVWQDFMFACTDYPSEDPTLYAEVEREADHQVRRLRNHPCIAVFAGNNEVDAIHELVSASLEPGNWGWHFFHQALPAAVERLAPEIAYWPSSPYGHAGVNGVLDGDRHAWEVWHGMDMGAGGPTGFASRGHAVHFHRYAHDKGKFISEFGIHAAPDLHTLERWTPPGSLAFGNAAFLHRNKDTPKDKGKHLMALETGLPTTLQEYVSYSMACQAEGLKFGIEHYRRRQPHCSGTLVWQLNDPWPGFSWSVVDHDLVPKAGYWFMERVHRPVVATFRTSDDGSLELWVSNSGLDPATLTLHVEVALFTGGSVVDETVAATVAGGDSRRVWSAPAERVQPGPDRFAWVADGAGAVEPNRLFFDHLVALPLDGSLDAVVGAVVDGAVEVMLTARGYCYFVAVTSPVLGLVLSQNYLDLRDGASTTIRVTNLPDGFDPATLEVSCWSGRASVRAA